MAGRTRTRNHESAIPSNTISLNGRGPHDGLWSVVAVVMIVVAILFVLGVLTGSLLEVAPVPADEPSVSEVAP